MKGGEKKARSQQGAIEVRLNRALEDVERQKSELTSLRARSQVGVACCLQWAWLVYLFVSGVTRIRVGQRGRRSRSCRQRTSSC